MFLTRHKNGFLAVLSLFLALNVSAKEVTLRLGDYTANADWESSPEGADKPVVLIVHGTMGHKDMELIQQAQDLLQENGYDSLAINLTLNRDNRHGFMPCDAPQTHRHEDAIGEIAAWADWLKQQGRHQLILMGHSRGGLQVAQYQAARHDPAVVSLALLAPMANRGRNTGGTPVSALGGQETSADAPEGFLHCARAPQVSQASRESYRLSGKIGLLQALQEIRVPVDVFTGSDDASKGVIRLTEIAAKPSLKHVRGHEIEGADHFFRDLYLDEVAETLVAHWQQLNPDKNAIQAVMSQQQSAWNRGDIDGFMQGYAKKPDLRFASGDQITQGWQATLDRYKKSYGPEKGKKPMGSLRFQLLEIRQPAPDFATVFGRWQLNGLDNSTPAPHGLFTLFWQKTNDQWRIVADHTSSGH